PAVGGYPLPVGQRRPGHRGGSGNQRAAGQSPARPGVCQMRRDALTTLAEQTNFRQTGRIDEVERLSSELAATRPDAVRSMEYGRSVEGRPMRALIVSRTGALSPEQIRARKIPLLMLQGGIHPGESDGKDAGFMALRELLDRAVAADVLERIAILFV